MNLAMMELNLDLSLAPPTSQQNPDTVTNHHSVSMSAAVPVASNDLDVVTNDVILSSAVEACTNKRRRRIYAEPEGVFLAMMREDNCHIAARSGPTVPAPPPRSPPPLVISSPPPAATSLSCPICLDPFTQETSTRCGHIFCRECIMGALAVKSVCPTCRKRVTKRGLIRIFLPSPNSP